MVLKAQHFISLETLSENQIQLLNLCTLSPRENLRLFFSSRNKINTFTTNQLPAKVGGRECNSNSPTLPTLLLGLLIKTPCWVLQKLIFIICLLTAFGVLKKTITFLAMSPSTFIQSLDEDVKMVPALKELILQ